MTRLEKARQLKPGMSDRKIMELCPWRFFGWPQKPEQRYSFRCEENAAHIQGETYDQWEKRVCRPCWNQPYKEMKP
jgi:hypothetical protein